MKMKYDVKKSYQKKAQKMYDANNAFAMKHQRELDKYAAKDPMMPQECEKFDACMSNDGERTQAFGRILAKDLDKVAFPMK